MTRPRAGRDENARSSAFFPRLFHGEGAEPAVHLIRGALMLKGAAQARTGDAGRDARAGLALERRAPVFAMGDIYAAGAIAALDLIESALAEPTLFPNGNRGMPLALTYWACREGAGVSVAAAGLVARQLADGRAFLQGAEPGLADLQSRAALLNTPDDVLPPAVAAWRPCLEATLKERAAAGAGFALDVRAMPGDAAAPPELHRDDIGAWSLLVSEI